MVIKKLQKSGNAYSVYLPMKWIKQMRLDESLAVSVTENNDRALTISPAAPTEKKPMEKEIIVEHYEPKIVHRILTNCYLDGYDKFTLLFEKPLTKKEIAYHKKRIESLGLAVEILEFSQYQAVFYSSETVMPIKTLLANQFNKLLNFIRAKSLREREFADSYKKEVERSRFMIERFFRKALKEPTMLRNSDLKLFDCLFIKDIAVAVKDASDVEIGKLSKKDIEIFKEVIGQAIKSLNKLGINNITKYDTITKKVRDEELKRYLKRIERYLIGWYLS